MRRKYDYEEEQLMARDQQESGLVELREILPNRRGTPTSLEVSEESLKDSGSFLLNK